MAQGLLSQGYLTQGLMTLFLFAASVIDIIRRKLSVHFIIMGFLIVGISQLGVFFIMDNAEKWQFTFTLFCGLILGLLFVLISIVTRERLGKADSLLFCICGLATGFGKLLAVIMLSFLLGAIYSIAMMAIGRLNRKSSFAFAPFILLGYIMVLFIR